MKEMVLFGRGGEGVLLASQILAETFARAGCFVQSFPEFTAERRGAPISAFLRWDESAPIHRRYKVRECDVLAVVSPAPPPPEILDMLRPGGLAVLNRDLRFPHSGAFEIARVPASRLARECGVLSAEGRPLGNVAVLGACVKLLLPGGLGFLEQAVASRIAADVEANLRAARQGYARCTRQRARPGDSPFEPVPAAAPRRRPVFPVSTTDSRGNLTGTWSLDRPVLFPGCSACALCALFCPEGAIARRDGAMVVDYLHCKGCGICEAVCPVRNAIAMEEVHA